VLLVVLAELARKIDYLGSEIFALC